MERGRSVRAVVVLYLVIGLLLVVVGKSTTTTTTATTSFKECYIPCFIFCVLKPGQTAYYCSFECLKDCIIFPYPPSPPSSSTTNNNNNNTIHHPTDFRGGRRTHHFCKLGCASSLCTNLSTRQNPGGEEVESCVSSCSGMCTKNYLSP